MTGSVGSCVVSQRHMRWWKPGDGIPAPYPRSASSRAKSYRMSHAAVSSLGGGPYPPAGSSARTGSPSGAPVSASTRASVWNPPVTTTTGPSTCALHSRIRAAMRASRSSEPSAASTSGS